MLYLITFPKYNSKLLLHLTPGLNTKKQIVISNKLQNEPINKLQDKHISFVSDELINFFQPKKYFSLTVLQNSLIKLLKKFIVIKSTSKFHFLQPINLTGGWSKLKYNTGPTL